MDKKSAYYSLFGIVLFMFVVPSRSGEFFSAIFRMESLTETHKYVAEQLKAILDEDQRLLDSIKRLLQRYEEEHTEAQKDTNKYLGNPINTFSLIKQLTVGLDDIQKMLNGSVKSMTNLTLVKKGLRYPKEEDLTGAAAAIGRLQEFYKLSTTELAAGFINGEKISRELTFEDCMSLARGLHKTENYQLAISWMEEALRKYKQIEDVNVHFMNEMQDFVAFSYYQLGDVESAREWTLKILKSEPNDLHASSNLKHYERVLQQRKYQADDKFTFNEDFYNEYLAFIEKYHSACRGEFEILPNITKSLKCYYMNENHAFLKIAPFKVEELYYYPKAYIVHDVVTDDEIDFLKNISTPAMTRATVVHKDGSKIPSAQRTSQFSWLEDSVHPRVAAISRRTSHFTGLSMTSAERLQISNYGIGGYYAFHQDYFWLFGYMLKFLPHFQDVYRSLDIPASGDRFGTVMFYLSDVEQGGATAFLHLGLTVFPKKASVLVWHNLHPSGQGNELTWHTACPVLLGDKWVANKWIRSSGQELRWPCHLDREYGLDVQAPPIRRKQPLKEAV